MPTCVLAIRVLGFFLLCVSVAVPALAQGGFGAVSGTATDASGAVLPGVTVTLSNPGTIGGNQVAVTDARGGYQFPRLVPGRYSVKGELVGFRAYVVEGRGRQRTGDVARGPDAAGRFQSRNP